MKLQMESQQLPIPKEVRKKIRMKKTAATATATPQHSNRGLSMAVADLQDSIAVSTEKANQLQQNIAKQQQELTEVLTLLRKQDSAVKLLANYANDGVNNPLLLMQEIHGLLNN